MFAIIGAILGIGYYVTRYIHSACEDKAADRMFEARSRAIREERERFRQNCVDVDGSKYYRELMQKDLQFKRQVQKDMLATLRGVPGFAWARSEYCYHWDLVAFLHFTPTGRVYDWNNITYGAKPFGMSVENAEAVMRWGLQQLRKHGVYAKIYKSWNQKDVFTYDWYRPLCVKGWTELE